jgi:hypothetical protein
MGTPLELSTRSELSGIALFKKNCDLPHTSVPGPIPVKRPEIRGIEQFYTGFHSSTKCRGYQTCFFNIVKNSIRVNAMPFAKTYLPDMPPSYAIHMYLMLYA